MPNQDEYLEDTFLRDITQVVHYDKECKNCGDGTANQNHVKRQQMENEVVRFSPSFVLSLNRVFWNEENPPQRVKDSRKVNLRQTLSIPQAGVGAPPIKYYLAACTYHAGKCTSVLCMFFLD